MAKNLEDLNEVIGSLESKSIMMGNHQRELTEIKAQIQEKFYHSIPQYLVMFASVIKQRDPSIDAKGGQDLL